MLFYQALERSRTRFPYRHDLSAHTLVGQMPRLSDTSHTIALRKPKIDIYAIAHFDVHLRQQMEALLAYVVHQTLIGRTLVSDVASDRFLEAMKSALALFTENNPFSPQTKPPFLV